MGLAVNNSLSGQAKVEFFTKDGSPNVSWYICGPTVYDTSHLGHARNYVSFDVLRRILEGYFNYNVCYVMNVTDVDDKIIKRARRNHLLSEYLRSAKNPELVLQDLRHGFEKEIAEQRNKVNDAESELLDDKPSQRSALEKKLDEERHKLFQLEQAQLAASVGADCAVTGIAADVLASLLDERNGCNINDHRIFRDLAARYEKEFFEDLDCLGVKAPDVVTRVTEYMDKIIDYVDTIVSKGFAYEANGSVYFDTVAFREAGHVYAKLRPSAVGSLALSSEGETNFLTGEKRNVSDFAVWKKSKLGEPYWESKWGRGRPGWHIECSAMASDIFGSSLDIHSGGKDLEFPHHDNELAQSEAYHGCSEWVRYFLHCGHLSINSRKMSKSTKNFITIRDAMKKHTGRQLRMYFVMHAWDKPLDYTDAAVAMAASKEKQFQRFFENVTDFVSKSSQDEPTVDEDMDILRRKIKDEVQLFMEDNFNTPEVINCLTELVNKTSSCIENHIGGRDQVREVALFVTRILRVLGLSNVEEGQIGFEADSVEAAFAYCVNALVSFRDAIRHAAKQNASMAELLDLSNSFENQVEGSLPDLEKEQAAVFTSVLYRIREAVKENASKGKIMQLADSIRDEALADVGVRLEDGQDAGKWQFVGVERLKWERSKKIILAEQALKDKLLRKKLKELMKARTRAAKDVDKLKQIQDEIADINSQLINLEKGCV